MSYNFMGMFIIVMTLIQLGLIISVVFLLTPDLKPKVHRFILCSIWIVLSIALVISKFDSYSLHPVYRVIEGVIALSGLLVLASKCRKKKVRLGLLSGGGILIIIHYIIFILYYTEHFPHVPWICPI